MKTIKGIGILLFGVILTSVTMVYYTPINVAYFYLVMLLLGGCFVWGMLTLSKDK